MGDYDTKEGGSSVGGEIKNFNSSKQVTEFQDQRLVKELLDSFFIARRGYKPTEGMDDVSHNKRVENRVKGLYLVTQALRDLIMRGRGEIESDEYKKWNVRNKTKKPEERIPFEKDENDFNRLEHQRERIKACQMDIKEAEKTPSPEDDFMIIKHTGEGEIYETTSNYDEMVDELEDSWREIERILKAHSILSQGMVEDEMLSFEELADEAKRRFIDS